jgi:selenide,water dikinase
VLARILAEMPAVTDERVLVGFDHADDAAVYLLEPGRAIVQTVDFFTPVVDDPRVYGRIAAANAVSDVYAMGGRPLFALSVLAFPEGVVDESVVVEIVQGGAEKLREAGIPVLGGHSVQDQELKFGYCVTGEVNPNRLWTNAGARPGDALILTKPIGTGIITTGVKFGKTPADVLQQAVAVMEELNRTAAETLADFEVHAATDITGCGLAGHAWEMARASRATLSFDARLVPVLPGVPELARKGMLPGGIQSNRAFVGDHVSWNGVSEILQQILFDPQTSGGLLVCCAPAQAMAAVEALHGKSVQAVLVGEVKPGAGAAGRLEFRA